MSAEKFNKNFKPKFVNTLESDSDDEFSFSLHDKEHDGLKSQPTESNTNISANQKWAFKFS